MDEESEQLNQLTDLMMVFPRKMNTLGRKLTTGYLKDSRLKPYHLMILRIVSEGDGVSQKELVASTPFDKSYISTGVRDLIEWGYVVNESGGKVYSLRLTDPGRDMVVMAGMLFELVEVKVMSVLTEDERRSLKVIMTKLNAHADSVIASYSERDQERDGG